MAVSTKMTVDVSGFKSGMQQAQASVKTLDAELKKNEAQFKATGNAEDYMAKKADILKQKLSTQKQAVDQAEKALNAMGKEVDKSSVEYQKMAQTLLNAQTAMLETQSALDGLSSSEKAAAEGANNLNQSVQSINKKVSLDQVISGINGITSVMEKAAGVAVRLGDTIWSSIMDSAQLADEIATNAAIMGIDTTEYQKYKGVFDTFAEITVRDWMTAKRKIENAMYNPSNDQTDALKALGFDTYVGSYVDENGKLRKRQIADNWEDAMWEIAGEIRTRVENGTLSEGMADIYGMALFGKNYTQLNPLFEMGQEGFNAEKETIKAANEEAIKNEALLNDTVIKLTGTFEALKMQALGTLAPALTAAAEAIDNLLGKILEYLQTDEGQEMLRQMGESLGELFSGITEISASDVVEGFKSVFDDLVKGIQWLAEHKDDVITAIEGIFGVFTSLKVSEGVLTLIKLFNGAKTLFGGNGGSPTGTDVGGGSGLGLLATKVASGLASNLTMYDPNGLTAMIYNSVMDLTTYGWERKTGKSIGEALKAQWGEITGGINAEGIAASAEEARKYWFEKVPDAFWGIFGFKSAQEGATKVSNNLAAMNGYVIDSEITADEAMRIINGEPVDLVLNPVVEENAEESIQEQVGTVTIPVNLAVQGTGLLGSFMEAALGLVPGGSNEGHGFANGLPWVNSDGLYLLHRGERVLTASQNRNYTYNSNNYFGNVNLNNGQDIEALCDSIDRHNRRRQSGFGE